MSYTIIEVANTHGGNAEYLNTLIDSFSQYNENIGIKFQPLHPDKLATTDFVAYEIYKKLHFENGQWKSFIVNASRTKDVWLDLFDDYGVEVLEDNIQLVHGIKLQVSVLFNFSLVEKLSGLDLSNLKLIINVASLNEEEIRYHYDKIKASLNVKELLIEVGFQAYPTTITDSGLSKIQVVKDLFNCKIVFADHVDGTNELALWLPVLAIASGADCIEKHVMLSDDFNTEFDFYSSITPKKFDILMERVALYDSLMKEPFINNREQIYLTNSILKPILKKDKYNGNGISLVNDLEYKRSNKNGINAIEIEKLLNSYHILSSDIKAGSTLMKHDFKKATIAVVIAARLKSSRLKEKALLKIGSLTTIEKCIKNACAFENVNNVILATSTLDSDTPLKNYTFSDKVIFHRGDPDDVIDRYLQIVRDLKIDVIIRVTGDNPFIDNSILQILLNSHFKTGADYTTAKEAAIGTNLEIINSSALEEVKSYFPNAAYSEYMTWYFTNNESYFNLNFVNLPNELIRPYRLTLDYDLDLEMFRKIHEHLSVNNTDYNLKDVFTFLDANNEISSINSHISAKYKTDQSLIDTLNEKTKIKTL
ncbi:spore coat polysaccharide biosynthesis protein SpsF (cytidylyltransferase family) [Gillisia sp. Hel_I_86]|uniref:cytidylyltransferase domain-containing protein n=1 Tax=Gillisia sp. Hel_I_86 TaxID=1249981 RepID=UPI00119C7CF5|nr:N-acetylneuraminate synthase family protein [Gillisia sp. Hel_I_86]TVZ28220.1 spore coat polysaccharide biosynthesis protein SpsF (cytidylyltransferase family) [Gillisia sp. Hel_I_86]